MFGNLKCQLWNKIGVGKNKVQDSTFQKYVFLYAMDHN